MAEELEKKPGFVVHKKQAEAAPAQAPEKKRVVVVKKKPVAQPAPNAAPAASTKPAAETPKHVVVKKADAPAETQEKPAAPSQEKPAAQPVAPAQKNDSNKPRSFELNPSRPNVKAGNLSDRPRGNFNRNGQGGG